MSEKGYNLIKACAAGRARCDVLRSTFGKLMRKLRVTHKSPVHTNKVRFTLTQIFLPELRTNFAYSNKRNGDELFYFFNHVDVSPCPPSAPVVFLGEFFYRNGRFRIEKLVRKESTDMISQPAIPYHKGISSGFLEYLDIPFCILKDQTLTIIINGPAHFKAVHAYNT